MTKKKITIYFSRKKIEKIEQSSFHLVSLTSELLPFINIIITVISWCLLRRTIFSGQLKIKLRRASVETICIILMKSWKFGYSGSDILKRKKTSKQKLENTIKHKLKISSFRQTYAIAQALNNLVISKCRRSVFFHLLFQFHFLRVAN